MSDAQTQGMPRRVIVLIVLGALVPFLVAGVTLYTTLIRKAAPSFEVVHDYLESPQTIPERVRQAGDELRRVDVSRSGIEVYDVGGQRHSIGADGQIMRRGGAVPVPAQSFRVDDVDFGQLPGILAAVEVRTGKTASNAKLEYVGDELLWTLTYWGETDGANVLYFSPVGELRQASNAR